MKIIVLILASLICIISCKHNNCDIADYKNGDWNEIDTSISYKICSQSKEALKSNDSIEIEFLGILKDQQKVLIQTDENLSLFTLLSNVPFGSFRQKEIASNLSLSKILPLITKNSECLLKYKFNEIQMPKMASIVTLYFKQQTDTTKIVNLNKRISSLNYVDSISYLSSDAAIEKWSEENDSTWKSFLQNNPLPSSTTIYVNKEMYDSNLKDSITSKLSTEDIISEISFPKDISSELSKLSKSLQFPFFIKIKSWLIPSPKIDTL